MLSRNLEREIERLRVSLGNLHGMPLLAPLGRQLGRLP